MTEPAEARKSSTVREIPLHEKALVVSALVIVFFGTINNLLPGGADSRTGGSSFYQALTGSIYLAGVLTLLCRGIPKWLFTVLWRAAPLILLLLLTLVSAIWSQDPGVTARRAVALLMGFSFAVYLVARFDLRTLFNLLTISFLIFAIFGLVAAFSGVGIGPNGAWRGFVGQKNYFGRTLALAVTLIPVAVVLGLTDWRKSAILASFAAVGMLFLSHSATSLGAGFTSVGLGPILYLIFGGSVRGFRPLAELRIILALLVLATGIFVVVWGQSLVLDILGRDPTLSGRTSLWQWALAQNEDRKWLGAGYRAFWIDENTRYFFERFSWRAVADGERSDSYAGPTHAHSGYMDTYLELGILGLTMLGATLASGLVHLRRTLSYGKNEVGIIFATLTSFLFIYAYTARSFLQQAEDLWFLFTVFFLFVVKEGVTAEAEFKSAFLSRAASGTLPPSLVRDGFTSARFRKETPAGGATTN